MNPGCEEAVTHQKSHERNVDSSSHTNGKYKVEVVELQLRIPTALRAKLEILEKDE